MINVLIRKRLIMGEYNKSNEYGINPDCEYSTLPEEINKPGNEYNNSAKEFNFSGEAEYNKSEDAKQQDFQSIGKKNQKSLRNIMKLGATAVAVFVLSTLMVNNGGDTLFGFSYTNDYINNGNVKKEISDNTYKPDDSSGKGKGTSEIPDADNANYTVKLVKVSDDTYSGVTAVTDNLLVASKNGKWGLIDGSGKIVKDFIYDNAGVFNDDFIGYVLVTNNSNGSTQQIFDSDNKLVYTRECESNENIIGYTEGYVHIQKSRTEEEIARTRGKYDVVTQVGEFSVHGDQSTVDKDTYVYINNNQIVSEFSIDGMDWFRNETTQENQSTQQNQNTGNGNNTGGIYGTNTGVSTSFGQCRVYSGSSDVTEGYIVPRMAGSFYYKVEEGKIERILIKNVSDDRNDVGMFRCRGCISDGLIYMDLYSTSGGKWTSPYSEYKKSYLYDVKTEELKEIDKFSDFYYFYYQKQDNENVEKKLFSESGYMFGIIKETEKISGTNGYSTKKKFYAINKNNLSEKIAINIGEVISSYRTSDKEILFVVKDDRYYGYIVNDDFENIKWYVYDASDFSESGYAIAADNPQYNNIIDTDFNVVGRVEKGTYSIAYCNYFVKKDENNTYTLYRLEKIK